MKLNICNIGNKEWLDFKADISFGIFFAFQDLGHDVTMSVNYLSDRRLNLIIGADFLADNSENVHHIVRSKIEYVIFELERFDETGINDRDNFNLELYKLLIAHAKFVITPYLYNVHSFTNLYGSEKIRYARWGFHEKMVKSTIVRQKNKFEFDALYFGLLKGRRAEKVQNLLSQESCNLKVLSRNDPILFKDYFVSCCEWGLNLSYGSAEKFINPFRLYYMISNGMPVLADGGNDEDNYLSVCEVVDFENFSEYLTSGNTDISSLQDRCRESKLSENLKHIL